LAPLVGAGTRHRCRHLDLRLLPDELVLLARIQHMTSQNTLAAAARACIRASAIQAGLVDRKMTHKKRQIVVELADHDYELLKLLRKLYKVPSDRVGACLRVATVISGGELPEFVDK
jgi:hypothetical protein